MKICVCEQKEGMGTNQVCLPKTFAHAKKLLRRGTGDDEVLCKIDTANAIEATDEGLARRRVESCHDGADKVGSEAALVEARGDEVGEGARGDGSLLAEAVHVGLVAEEVADGIDVRGEAGEAEEDVLAVLEDLREVV